MSQYSLVLRNDNYSTMHTEAFAMHSRVLRMKCVARCLDQGVPTAVLNRLAATASALALQPDAGNSYPTTVRRMKSEQFVHAWDLLHYFSAFTENMRFGWLLGFKCLSCASVESHPFCCKPPFHTQYRPPHSHLVAHFLEDPARSIHFPIAKPAHK